MKMSQLQRSRDETVHLPSPDTIGTEAFAVTLLAESHLLLLAALALMTHSVVRIRMAPLLDFTSQDTTGERIRN